MFHFDTNGSKPSQFSYHFSFLKIITKKLIIKLICQFVIHFAKNTIHLVTLYQAGLHREGDFYHFLKIE